MLGAIVCWIYFLDFRLFNFGFEITHRSTSCRQHVNLKHIRAVAYYHSLMSYFLCSLTIHKPAAMWPVWSEKNWWRQGGGGGRQVRQCLYPPLPQTYTCSIFTRLCLTFYAVNLAADFLTRFYTYEIPGYGTQWTGFHGVQWNVNVNVNVGYQGPEKRGTVERCKPIITDHVCSGNSRIACYTGTCIDCML